jgi:stringent starvation protein B
MAEISQPTTTRPYLIRAIYEWCTDNGYTPYIVVAVTGAVRVPAEFVKNGEIVLNVSFDATSGLQLGNAFIEFKGRFGGVARDIFVPVECVSAIYARENGQGMAFPVGDLAAAQAGSAGLAAKVVPDVDAEPAGTYATPDVPSPPIRPKPILTRIK